MQIMNVRDLCSNNKLLGKGEIEHSIARSDSCKSATTTATVNCHVKTYSDMLLSCPTFIFEECVS